MRDLCQYAVDAFPTVLCTTIEHAADIYSFCRVSYDPGVYEGLSQCAVKVFLETLKANGGHVVLDKGTAG